MHRGAFVDKTAGGKQLRVRLGFEIHVEIISILINFWGHTHRETIPTRNSIAIINHFSLNPLDCFIIATKTYLCSYVRHREFTDMPLEQNTDTSFWSSFQCLPPVFVRIRCLETIFPSCHFEPHAPGPSVGSEKNAGVK